MRSPRQIWQTLAWSASFGVLVLSLIPLAAPPAVDEFNLDKLVHAAMYATLMYCFARAHARSIWPRLALALVAYGGVIELLQGLTAYRSCSLFDALANACGISLMLFVLTRSASRARARRL